MTQLGLSRRTLGCSAAAAVGTFAVLRHPRGEEALKIRCSLDTAPSHVRNISIVDYLKKVEAATGGKVVGEVFHSGQLYADLNVAKALLQGQVDMAAPGGWTQTGIVSDCDFCQLPVFYGQPIEATERASDGRPGALIVKQIEGKLRVKVIGPWLDLGFQNWYTTKKPLNSSDDIRGLKIRSPGGAGISWRISFFGGIPNTTAWPNVPLALSQGTFDGFVSTNESVATAKLWEAGLKYSYQDRQYVGQYMPMISNAFWSKLAPDIQTIMLDTWKANIGGYRANAMASQTRARKLLEESGVSFTDPSPETIEKARKAMQADVGTLVKDAKLSPEIVRLSEESGERIGLIVAVRADTIWDTIERTLVGLLGALAMIVGLVQVLGRYFFPALAISWAEEVIVYLVVWGVMIISSQLVRTDGHVRPDLVLRLVPPGGQRWLEAFNCVVALVFCGGMVWYGWQIVDTSLLLDERSSSDLQFPMWIYYASLPAGGVLMTMRYAIRLYRCVFRFDARTMTVGHHIPEHELPVNLTTANLSPSADR